MKHIKSIIFACLGVTSLLSVSCGDGGKIKSLEAERDSLAMAANDANMRYDELSDLLGEISECVDSVSMQSEIALVTVDKETGRVYSRGELRQRVADLGSLIDRQRQRIAALSDSLNAKSINTKEVKRLTQLVKYLNEQLASKEAEMQRLQTELASSKRSIAELQTSVAAAQATNEKLTTENSALDQMVVEQNNQLNQGYFLAKPKKDLEKMGILSGGGFMKKAKFTPGAVSTSSCVPVDIRTFSQVELNSKKKPVMLSQAPASSYTFEEVGKGKWRLVITDTMSFWSLSKIVVIQLQ